MRKFFQKKHRLLIRYKSGQEQTVVAKSFKIERGGGELKSIEWEDVKPHPLFIGISDIESIWVLN